MASGIEQDRNNLNYIEQMDSYYNQTHTSR